MQKYLKKIGLNPTLVDGSLRIRLPKSLAERIKIKKTLYGSLPEGVEARSFEDQDGELLILTGPGLADKPVNAIPLKRADD